MNTSHFGVICLGSCMPTNFHLVHPQTTPYWEGYDSHSMTLHAVTLHSTSLLVRILHRLFSVLCPHSHTFWETFEKVTHLITTSSQTRLIVEFLSDREFKPIDQTC
ncbi:hypothetical protein JHK82_016201 [Glycine max]|uniref:Uncharacterized protein n=2 Tax=Glycine subgen. Soja TaxID=1462606 RepID=A0A0R0JQS6_SOYBN|nr:hypothetical protein JHK87_016135 [Glycine soja]KAG5032620.1 hypothetical protein JHK85_016602 [Glycine max]KAG5046825.1 hypothetical protein JHK86_016231 [Glycine max]KAG5149320.1 hypothetical protein JHK82_016201 [Glycine max]KRH55122.1 hypothetical protein GLYMA_06G232000v4 [Glycine max]